MKSVVFAALLFTPFLCASSHAEMEVNGYRIQVGDKMPPNSFAIVNTDDTVYFHGNTKDLKAIERLKNNNKGEFIWFRQSGNSYVVNDAAVITQVKQYWAGLNTEEHNMDVLQAKMDPLQEQMDEAQEEHEATADEEDGRYNNEAMQKISQKMRKISRQMKDIGDQMQEIGWRIEDLSETAMVQTMQALDIAVKNNKAVALK